MTWNVRKLIAPRFQCTSITTRFLSLSDRFTTYYNCTTRKVRKLVSQRFSIQVSKILLFCFFDRFTAYYNYMTWNVRKLLSLRSQCTSITNRFLSLIDRFTAYYSCMSRNLRKLVSPRFQCTIITNQFSYLIWLFYGLLQVYDLKCQKTHIFAISMHKYHKSFFVAYLTVLRLITTLWRELSENWYLRDFSAQVSKIVFLAYLTVLWLITTCMTWNVRKLLFVRFQCTSITNCFGCLFDCFTAY